MKTTTLGILNDEKSALAGKLAQLQAEQKELRAEMMKDPLHTAGALSPRWAALGVQIEVFTEKLGEVIQHIKREEDRINSPQVQAGIKRAEKILAENQALLDKIVIQFGGLLPDIEAALLQAQEAAQLLKIGGKDNNAALNGSASMGLGEIRQMLNGWIMARSERVNITAGFKQAEAARKARQEAKAKAEAEEKAKAKRKPGILEGFIKQAR